MSEFEQHPSAILDYVADFTTHCVRYRDPNTDYGSGVAAQPRRATGLQYRTSSAGRSGAGEPQWPTSTGRTVADGSLTWAPEPISTGSLIRTLDSVAWTAETGLTLVALPIVGTKATALISGGLVGRDYEVVCVGTCSDGTRPVRRFMVKVRAVQS